MFDIDLGGLDADSTLVFAAAARAVADRAEVRLIEAAAHWADLHGHIDCAGEVRGPLPGLECLAELGGDGTPAVAEFAPAELGAELQMSPAAAARLIGDALDLRHRLPRLWARILAGDVKPWIGRKTADTTRHLNVDIVAAVDARITPWAHSLSWSRLEAIVQATVICADPDGAAAAAEDAATSQGVWVSPSNDHGIKDIHIRTEAPHAIWFDATIDRIADNLRLLGDESTKDIRRARAVGLIAQPQRTIDLFEQAAHATDPVGKHSWKPAGDPEEPDTTAANSTVALDHSACIGGHATDPRPPATLYIHLGEKSFGRDHTGTARFEGVGPITVDQARHFLRHCQVSIKPVIDLENMTPVDSYEIPDRLREAVHLRSPVDTFPYTTNTSRRRDLDHTDPYRDPDHGGPPKQTRLDNLGPTTRAHHRIKTHSRWQVRQPFSGVFVWKTPHGRIYTVDHTGTTEAIKSA